MNALTPCCFLDRDGVVNVEKYYLHDPAQVELERGLVEALKLLRAGGYKIVVVTNQAGVAKGKYPEGDILAVHRRIDELLAPHGLAFDGYYYCVHHPDFTGPCDCRKPAPGMLLRAAREHGIDLAESYMVGDRLSDLQAGDNAGVRESILVRSGYGAELERTCDVSHYRVADTLLDAVRNIILG